MGDVISSIGIGTAVADSIGRQHGIGLTLVTCYQHIKCQQSSQSVNINTCTVASVTV